jgi:hypothetical protein
MTKANQFTGILMHLKDILNLGFEVTASILIVVTIFWHQML